MSGNAGGYGLKVNRCELEDLLSIKCRIEMHGRGEAEPYREYPRKLGFV